jgi:hypothetical protein
LKEVNELNIDTNYEIPLFDLFPIVVATLYKINLCIYPVSVMGEECHFKEPQVYKPLDLPSCIDIKLTVNFLYINGLHYELLYDVVEDSSE